MRKATVKNINLDVSNLDIDLDDPAKLENQLRNSADWQKMTPRERGQVVSTLMSVFSSMQPGTKSSRTSTTSYYFSESE